MSRASRLEVKTMKISTLLSGEDYMKSCVCKAPLRCTVSTLSIRLMAIQSGIIINEKSILTWGRRLARHDLKLAAKWQENGYGGQQPEAQRLNTHLPCHVGTRVHGAEQSGSHEELTAPFPLPLTFAPIPGPLCCRGVLASVRLTSCRRAKSKREEDVLWMTETTPSAWTSSHGSTVLKLLGLFPSKLGP